MLLAYVLNYRSLRKSSVYLAEAGESHGQLEPQSPQETKVRDNGPIFLLFFFFLQEGNFINYWMYFEKKIPLESTTDCFYHFAPFLPFAR